MYNVNTNFFDENGVDLGKKLVSKDYLMSYYPDVANSITTPELWGWGRNEASQLGDNTTTNSLTPVTTFAGGANWKQISAGRNHVFAIKTDGTLWGWGVNGSTLNSAVGRLGDNTSVSRSTPVTTISGSNDWKQVTAGRFHTAAIKTNGELWVWGGNYFGELGINSVTSSLGGLSSPVTTYVGGTNWKQVSSGYRTTTAIKTDGTLWTWGRNDFGQLGDDTTILRSIPIQVGISSNWKLLDSGGSSTVATKTDGTLWSWGYNAQGQLGDNTTVNKSNPVQVGISSDWKQVSCGYNFAAALKINGTLWTWGRNNFGQLGDNTSVDKLTPVTTFSGGTNWKQVSCGENSISAIKTDGTLWIWGRNDFGQLGGNNLTNSFTPITTFIGGNNWKQVSCGYGYASAIRSIDTV